MMRHRLIEALVDCVATSGASEVEELSQALEAWKRAFPRSEEGALRQSRLLRPWCKAHSPEGEQARREASDKRAADRADRDPFTRLLRKGLDDLIKEIK